MKKFKIIIQEAQELSQHRQVMDTTTEYGELKTVYTQINS